MNSKTKNCQNCKNDFTIEPEDFSFYEKIKVPPPSFCSECRLIRRLCWRNERFLYKRVCDYCKKNIVSIYDTDVSFPVYCLECWRSDNWDAMKYGQDYDFSKSFFKQWQELFLKIPRQSLIHLGNQNIKVDYANFLKDAKNVYLAYSSVESENVYYSGNTDKCEEVLDSYNNQEGNLLYENIGGVKNYNCQYAYWSSGCIDSSFILDCANCSDCFNCVNLRNKQYCIWNQQYTKEEYFEKLKSLNTGSHKFISENIKNFSNFSLKFPRKYARVINCVNSSGDEIRNCKNTLLSFNVYDTEDIKLAYRGFGFKNSMDVCYNGTNELAYEHSSGGSDQSYNIKFVINGGDALNEVEYVDLCQSSSNLFGCIGLKAKKYCILNKRYGKEEYFEMVEKIKKHTQELPYADKKGNLYKYGEFFPFEFSPFGYNETVINEIYPLSESEIKDNKYNWKEKKENKYTITKKAKDLDDDIKNIKDDIISEIIECITTKKPFKITPFELEFYRRMNIPVPRIHPDERFRKRLALRNPLKLWTRRCMCGLTSLPEITGNHGHKEKCPNEFETSYAPERPEIVYCEKCYQREVY